MGEWTDLWMEEGRVGWLTRRKGGGGSQTCAEGTEVLGSLGHNIRVEFHGNTSCTAKRMQITRWNWLGMQR